MKARRSFVSVILMIHSLHSLQVDGFQQVWIPKERIKPFHGATSDADTDLVTDTLAELSAGISDGAITDDPLTGESEVWKQPRDDPNPVVALEHAAVVSNATLPSHTAQPPSELTRRQWLQIGALAVGGAITTGHLASDTFRPSGGTQKDHKGSTATPKHLTRKGPISSSIPKKKLQRVNVTDVVRATNINLTMECTTTCVSLDRYTFEKKATLKLPRWVPSYLVPPPRTIRKMSDSEILVAALIAGSTVEMVRTSLLYPLVTLKSRIQADIKTRVRTRMKRGKTKRLHPKRRAKILQLNAIRHVREGKLYAGLLPSLLVTVPATGVYYGIRDVVRRSLNSVLALGDIPIAIAAALIADIVSLVIRTPADALAVRLQVATGKEQHVKNETEAEAEEAVRRKVGNWFVESLERLPAVIITDLPYLLSRIALNRYLIHGNIDLAHYELTTIATALVCGFLTTPFDVARTRILVDSDDDPTNGIDGGSGLGLITTMRTIMKEGDGGVANLFAGWLERTIYLAIGRAWLEPLQILGYMALRDAILLEWFD